MQARMPELNAGSLLPLLTHEAARRMMVEKIEPRMIGNRSAGANETVCNLAIQALNAYISCILVRNGWKCRTSPGEPLELMQGDVVIKLPPMLLDTFQGKAPATTILDLLWNSGIEAKACVKLSQEEIETLTRRRCIVSLDTSSPKHTDVTVQLSQMYIPQCCAHCCGPLEYTQEVAFKIGGMLKSNSSITLTVPLCSVHQSTGPSAWDIRKFDEKTTEAVIRLPGRDYAILIEKVNG